MRDNCEYRDGSQMEWTMRRAADPENHYANMLSVFFPRADAEVQPIGWVARQSRRVKQKPEHPMETNEGPIIVTLHCVRTGSYDDYAVFAGKNPFGPHGGRAGNAMNAECIARKVSFVDAVHIADVYVGNHPLALLVLTEGQLAGAEHVQRGELTNPSGAD